jgi:hypothetical protein
MTNIDADRLVTEALDSWPQASDRLSVVMQLSRGDTMKAVFRRGAVTLLALFIMSLLSNPPQSGLPSGGWKLLELTRGAPSE